MQAAVAFPADGTVSSVDVAVGDAVSVGQQLASLDLDDLTQDLHSAEATLADAELALRKALDGESVDSLTGSGGPTGTPTATTDDSTSEVVWAVATQNAGTGGELEALQQAVLDAQSAVDQAIAASEASLISANEVCSASGSTATATTTSSTIAGDDDTADLDACRTALDEVQAAQQATAAAQQQLAAAAAALDDYLLAQDGSGSGGSAGAGGPTGGGSGGSSAAPSGGSSTSSSPSSAELVALQQQVDAAALGVVVAQQAIAQATIVSPIAGTVVAVGFAAGDEVTSASATQTVTVQGEDGMEAVTTVALDEVTSVAVGQPATVVPDGSDAVIEGEVVAVAAVPDDDATTTSYRVTIGFEGDADELGNGTIGSVTIVTDDVRSALAVPTSAVTWTDGRATVQVVVDGLATASAVEVGAIGAQWTEILSGVAEGDDVVLADPADALPGAATESTQDATAGAGGGTGAGGGFPSGGGFPTGGPPSGFGGLPGN